MVPGPSHPVPPPPPHPRAPHPPPRSPPHPPPRLGHHPAPLDPTPHLLPPHARGTRAAASLTYPPAALRPPGQRAHDSLDHRAVRHPDRVRADVQDAPVPHRRRRELPAVVHRHRRPPVQRRLALPRQHQRLRRPRRRPHPHVLLN